MRRSGRSNVVTWLTTKAFEVRPPSAVKPAASLFCAIRLAITFARLSDRRDAKNAQIVFKQKEAKITKGVQIKIPIFVFFAAFCKNLSDASTVCESGSAQS